MNTIQPKLIWKALHQAAVETPRETAYVYENQKISFEEIDNLSDQFASSLLRLGYKKGDRLGIIALNQPEWLITYFAAAKIGVVIVGLNIRYRESELEYMINQSGMRGIVSTDSVGEMNYVSFFEKFKPKIPTVQDFIYIQDSDNNGATKFEKLLNVEINHERLTASKEAIRPEDLIMLIYTSGTTGQPKGAALTNKSQLGSAIAQAEHTRMTKEDTFVLALPLNHVGGITCNILACLVSRAQVIILPAFSPAAYISQLQNHQVTVLVCVPTIYTLLLNDPSFAAIDANKIRMVITGGSNAPPPLLKKMIQTFPNAVIMNLYGLSEVSGATVMSPWDSTFEQTLSSIGKPMGEFKAKVIDIEGKELPLGESGELCLKGAAVSAGYYDMPEKTKEAFSADGWLRTGDIASIDGLGYITLKGRLKEMYIQGGYNVYPVEVENVLAKHPKVQMVAGIGVPDEVLGEIGRYYIIPTPDTRPTVEELLDYCKDKLANYKLPKQIVFRETLPLTPAGKIMKSRLEEER